MCELPSKLFKYDWYEINQSIINKIYPIIS